ncbi:hypothetical protein NPD5_2112 [Clostridium sporogenes]|uniref:Uncharacterized protein n=1 Tax=Clostridium sporogenes TaxID=1509 RepID=A0A1L3NHD7_CLOSG|nr:hypothetical protein [Clostridium sporogenes]APH15491.1 hypothetical protein NPD5_2112 [Clostridium sporogenes]
MIKEFNQSLEKYNNHLGISVKLPDPDKNELNRTSILNFVVGTGLVVSSAFFAPKWCAVVGGVAIVSSIVLMNEANKK